MHRSSRSHLRLTIPLIMIMALILGYLGWDMIADLNRTASPYGPGMPGPAASGPPSPQQMLEAVCFAYFNC
ncbi:hypothetical protein JNJ66_00105 [Candidatus Saccharibacteria bacterium]|nr:hypothetical protein [Candidatus Saccharibacteria bacterium]